MNLVREAHIHGVERACGCGGTTVIMEIRTHHPESGSLRSSYWLRVCTTCGHGEYTEDTDEVTDARKVARKVIEVAENGFDEISLHVEFKKNQGDGNES